MRPLQHAGLEIRVAPSVLHQVVAAHEALIAKWAPELLLPRVGAVMAGQLVGASKLLTAVWPGTRKRPLSCRTEKEGKMLVYNPTKNTRQCSMVLRTKSVFLRPI